MVARIRSSTAWSDQGTRKADGYTYNVPMPTAQIGDLLVHVVYFLTVDDAGRLLGTKWTSRHFELDPLGGAHFQVFDWRWDGTSGESFTFNGTVGDARALVQTFAVSAGEVVEAVDLGIGSGTSLRLPGLTLSRPNGLVVLQQPWGLARILDIRPSFSTVIADSLYQVGQAASGPTGELAVTWQVSSAQRMAALAVRAANVAPDKVVPTYPAGNVTINRAATNRFSWPFSDPNSDDQQSRAEIRMRFVGGSTWTVFPTVTGPTTYTDYPPLTFAANPHEWQVQTYDALGLASGFGPSEFFRPVDPPPGPVLTAPVNGEVIGQATRAFTWSATAQDAFQARRVADLNGAPDEAVVYADSGVIEEPATRSGVHTFPVNGRAEHVQLRVRSQGLWSPWASVRVTISYTPPMTPEPQLLDGGDRLVVRAFNPTPAPGRPAVTSNDVLVRQTGHPATARRLKTGLAPLTSWPYFAASEEDVEVQLVAYGDNATQVSSAWVGTFHAGPRLGDVIDPVAPIVEATV